MPIGYGLVASFYFFRRRESKIAVGLGGSLIATGIFILMGSYGIIQTFLVLTLLGLTALVLTLSMYSASGRPSRMILPLGGYFFGVFVLPVVEFFVFPFPSYLVLVYCIIFSIVVILRVQWDRPRSSE